MGHVRWGRVPERDPGRPGLGIIGCSRPGRNSGGGRNDLPTPSAGAGEGLFAAAAVPVRLGTRTHPETAAVDLGEGVLAGAEGAVDQDEVIREASDSEAVP